MFRDPLIRDPRFRVTPFWQECEKFLQAGIGAAVDERRHGVITHLAYAISVPDLLEQVKSRCPSGTNIPCESWLRLQFWPKNPHFKSKIHYTGQLNVKFMVQARQFRKEHEDSHYAAALFRYERELSVLLRKHSNFMSIDDKHRLKVGEPGFPVAAAERGRKVIVSHSASFEVADHDFTKCSIVPSVCLLVDIPEEIDGSWYRGKVYVGFKDAIFEPSSPLRHSAELQNILVSSSNLSTKPILFLYCDGGPDHRVTYVSVQLSLISLFLALDLDFLCVCRTAPYHSWKNPVERVMSILNLGFQSVGLMRKQIDDESESSISKCNNMAQLRKMAEGQPAFVEKFLDSIEPVKSILSDIIVRLKLKGTPFETYCASNGQQMREIWENLHVIDASLNYDEKIKKAGLKSYPDLQKFHTLLPTKTLFFLCKKMWNIQLLNV